MQSNGPKLSDLSVVMFWASSLFAATAIVLPLAAPLSNHPDHAMDFGLLFFPPMMLSFVVSAMLALLTLWRWRDVGFPWRWRGFLPLAFPVVGFFLAAGLRYLWEKIHGL